MTATQAFRYYNLKYFRGRLPKDTRIVWADLTEISALGRFNPSYALKAVRVRGPKKGELRTIRSAKPKIELDKRLKWAPSVWHRTLLHEMVHLKLDKKYPKGGHGHAFQREMKRLARIGAFNLMW